MDEFISNPMIKFNYRYLKNNVPAYSNISKPTFDRDIKHLKNIINEKYNHLALEFNGKLLVKEIVLDYYYYKVPSIRAFDDLNFRESAEIANLLNRCIQLFPDQESLIQKIIAKSISFKAYNDEKLIHWDPIQLIYEGKRVGSEKFIEILQSISLKSPLKIIYKSNKGIKEYKILPVLLKEIHNGWYASWYLLAMKLEKNIHLTTHVKTDSLTCFALEKITLVEKIKLNYPIQIKEDFNPKNYFKSTLGIWRENLNFENSPPLIKVKFLIKNDSWIKDYLIAHPIHETQELEYSNDQQLIGYITVEETIDLIQLFVRFSDQFVVLEPQNIREKIRKNLLKSISDYN